MIPRRLLIVLDELPQDCRDVPLPASSDKLHEAVYFYTKVLETYHEPDAFRYNLNAFIQSQRSIEDVIEKELAGFDVPGASLWFRNAKARLKNNPLLAKLHSLRNFVVHRGMLQAKSRAFVGVMKHRKVKFGTAGEVDPFVDSRELLHNFTCAVRGDALRGISDDHPFIGEEYGVQRTWIVEELGDADVTEYCRESFQATQCVARQAVALAGGWLRGHELPSASGARILTETDVDPSLIEKWGWV